MDGEVPGRGEAREVRERGESPSSILVLRMLMLLDGLGNSSSSGKLSLPGPLVDFFELLRPVEADNGDSGEDSTSSILLLRMLLVEGLGNSCDIDTPREPLTDVFEGLDRGVPCEEVNPLSTSLAINSDRSDSDWKEPEVVGCSQESSFPLGGSTLGEGDGIFCELTRCELVARGPRGEDKFSVLKWRRVGRPVFGLPAGRAIEPSDMNKGLFISTVSSSSASRVKAVGKLNFFPPATVEPATASPDFLTTSDFLYCRARLSGRDILQIGRAHV